MGQKYQENDVRRKGGLCSYVPARYVIAAMCFLAVFLEYAVKVCMSVVIVAMVKRVPQEEPHTSNSTTMATKQDDVCPGTMNTESTSEINGEFDWDEQLQSYILGATSYGILMTHVLGGRLSEKFGSKYVLLPSLFLTGLFTVLCPIFARWHVAAFISIRVLVGISSGVIFPSVQVLISRWYTIEERQFISSIIYSSVHICTVTTLSLSGVISDELGWPYVFYLNGGLTILWIIPWMLLVYDSPMNHPRISEEEKNLIMNSLVRHKKNKVSYAVPWLAILTSVPVWAHIAFAFGYAWVSATLVSELPTYLSTILHFNLKESGFTSAVPFIFHPIGGMFFGYLGQKVRLSGYISPLNSMRLFNTICGVLSPILLFMITLVGCDATATIVFLCCSQLAISAYYGGSLVNNLDLASNFAGTISGISITIVGVASVATPLIVGALTDDNQTLTQWHIVFYISISVTLFSYVIFTIFGSVEEQPWNKVGTENHESQTPENISKNQEDV